MVLGLSSVQRHLSRAALLVIIGLNCAFSFGNLAYAGCQDGTETCGPNTYCAHNVCVPDDAGKTENGPIGIQSNRNLILLQPLDGSTSALSPAAGIGIFFDYFNLSWPWVLGVGAGIGVLQALIGSIEVMISGSDSGMRESGKGKIMWALAGLLMIGLAGFILRSINPIFFT